MTWTRRSTLKSKSKESSFCVGFSPDDRLLCTGAFDGILAGYDSVTAATKFEFDVTPQGEQFKVPITSFKFRPAGRDMILIGCCNGSVLHWDPRTQRTANTFKEENNEIYAVDYRRDGNLFATAGRDRHIRVYDETTGKLVRQFTKGSEYTANVGATRIYAVKFLGIDDNIFVSGGWENTIAVWDLRVETHQGLVGEMFGPYLTGEALDSAGATIVTGSHRLEERVELWDFTTLSKIKEVPWPKKNGDCMVTCCKFSPAGDLIATGGGGGLGLRNMGVIMTPNGEVVLDFQADKSVNSVAFGKDIVAFGDGSGQIHLFEKKGGGGSGNTVAPKAAVV